MEVSIVYLYYFGAIFPFLAVVSCWICFYSLGHFNSDHILTISETVISFPENRIFPSTMCMESIILIILFNIRNNAITRISKEKKIPIPYMAIINLLSIICPAGLILVSVLTLEDQLVLHLLGAILFFFGSFLYYILTDSALKRVGCCLPFISKFVTYLIVFLFIAHYGMFSQHSPFAKSLGSLFQYALAFSIFSKIILFYYELPNPIQTPKRN